MARQVLRLNMGLDIRDVLPQIDLPTLILHRTDDSWIDVGHARYLARHVPNATYVELPGSDHRPWVGDVDALVDEIEIFLTGQKRRPRSAHEHRRRRPQPARARGGPAGVTR